MKHKVYTGKPKAGELPYSLANFLIKIKGRDECNYRLCKGDNLETITTNKYFQIKINDCTVVLLPLENLDYFLCNFWSVNNDGKND